MSIEDDQIQVHFYEFIEFVGPSSHPTRREEYAQYCRGLVAASMIGGLISVQRGREMNALIQQARDAR